MLSEEQAEPEWTATPTRSSPMSTGSALDAGDAEADDVGESPFGGRTDDRDPFHGQCRLDDRGDLTARGDGLQRHRFAAGLGSAAAAAPKARRAGSASTPARRARSCSPPTRSGSNRLPRRTISAPAPDTPPNLCALMLTSRPPAPPGPAARARTRPRRPRGP